VVALVEAVTLVAAEVLEVLEASAEVEASMAVVLEEAGNSLLIEPSTL